MISVDAGTVSGMFSLESACLCCFQAFALIFSHLAIVVKLTWVQPSRFWGKIPDSELWIACIAVFCCYNERCFSV